MLQDYAQSYVTNNAYSEPSRPKEEQSEQVTDINKLSEEFLNLAYHGMRANIKDFNCAIEKNLDATFAGDHRQVAPAIGLIHPGSAEVKCGAALTPDFKAEVGHPVPNAQHHGLAGLAKVDKTHPVAQTIRAHPASG